MTKTTAQDRRVTAVANIVNNAFAEGYYRTRQEYISQVAALRALGKTDRWIKIIDSWIETLSDVNNPVDWAILQYAVYAGYAA